MKELMLTVSDDVLCHQRKLYTDKPFTIGSETAHTLTFPDLEVTFEAHYSEGNWVVQDTILKLNKMTRVSELNFHLAESLASKSYDISTNLLITIGKGRENDLILKDSQSDVVLMRESTLDPFEVYVYQGVVYHNSVRLNQKKALAIGDYLHIDGVTLRINQDELIVESGHNDLTSKLTPLVLKTGIFPESYPNYQRSPRIIYRVPEDKITFASPPNPPSKRTEGLLKMIMPPLVMMTMTVVLSIFQPRGIFILMTLTMTGMSIINSTTSYVKSRKKYKVETKKRIVDYEAYLQRKATEIYEVREKQKHALSYHYPDIETIQEMTRVLHSRIYEKTRFHHDFLTFRVGVGHVKSSFSIEYKEEEFTQEKDELKEAANQLKHEYSHVDMVPIGTDLMNGPVGYIGPRRLVLKQLQQLVMQIAFFHSYYDVQFVTIFPEEEKEQWEWMRWLPHANLRDVNVRGFVYHDRSRDQVLNTLYQILKSRKQNQDEKKSGPDKTIFTPHYVVLITDEKLILDHMVMEFFNEDISHLGVSLIFVQDVMQSLPEHVKAVIDIRDTNHGNIVLEQGELVNRHFDPDLMADCFDKESISRGLAPLNHLQNLKNSIPESVTFLEMYNIETVEELDIKRRWQQNETYKSLAVPLGLRGKDDIVLLNLHEKAHGPHGLVAGTTGSGKSEIIQSYILSLAVNFHPYEVAFLLIDYKGGGMANLFKDLPHLVGTITNLDGAQSMRALASIKAELQKRQRLFGEFEVNHINQYQKLYKQGKVTEPMPHLFLISDEFAELKSEQPEFMKELVSTARIGRSLGIHLILATQKPSGVVDDQIWSNSKFKLALKVQNASDSNEMLKTPDAADITLPGRAYLQVGNNEIYELFQSAWSGADYVKDKNDEEHIDTTVYAINDLGQYDILTEDLSGLEKKEDLTKLPSELDAVIEHIDQYTKEAGIEALPKPWLPPLAERIYLPELHPVNYQEMWEQPKGDLECIIGMIDEPQLQSQSKHRINLTYDGHLAVFSSPAFGKSTFLQMMMLGFAREHSPEHLHAYLLDFGTNGLLPIKDLPHVADTISLEELEKTEKFVRRLTAEIKERKKMLKNYSVASLKMYEEASKTQVPSIILVIDNYDAIKEEHELQQILEPLINQVAREGAGIGIHLLISGVRHAGMKAQLISNIKTQISLYLIDGGESKSIVGRTDLVIEEIPGRALIKLEEPTLLQVALPNIGESALEIIEANQSEAKAMAKHWQGECPMPIPMVPEDLTVEQFLNTRGIDKSLEAYGSLPVGLEYEFAMPVAVPLYKQHLMISCESAAETVTYLMSMVKILHRKSDINIILIDQPAMGFIEAKAFGHQYLTDADDIEEAITDAFDEFKEREEAYLKNVQQSGSTVNPVEFYQKYPAKCLVFNGINQLFEGLEANVQNQLLQLFKQDGRTGIWMVMGGEMGMLGKGGRELVDKIRENKLNLIGVRLSDQSTFSSTVRMSTSTEKQLERGEAYLLYESKPQKIKIGL